MVYSSVVERPPGNKSFDGTVEHDEGAYADVQAYESNLPDTAAAVATALPGTVSAWLDSLGMSHCYEAFRDSGYDDLAFLIDSFEEADLDNVAVTQAHERSILMDSLLTLRLRVASETNEG